jgi:hypothetical protein
LRHVKIGLKHQEERIELFASGKLKMVGFEFVTAASMKMAISLMMEAVSTSETSVNFNQTTRCNNPADSNLQVKNYLKLTKWARILVLRF